MSRNAKIVLGVIGGLVACCCITILMINVITGAFAWTVGVLLPQYGEQFMEDAITTGDGVNEVARSIVDYNLPAGLEEEMAMNFFGVKTAVFRGSNEQSLIMLMQFPSVLAGNEAEMQRQMEDSFSQQFGTDDYRFEVVSREELTINGQPASLTTSESVENDVTIRQVIGVFQSKDGSPAMVMAMAPVDRWQQDGIDRFLESMQQEGTGR
jgi:hypothetical protein